MCSQACIVQAVASALKVAALFYDRAAVCLLGLSALSCGINSVFVSLAHVLTELVRLFGLFAWSVCFLCGIKRVFFSFAHVFAEIVRLFGLSAWASLGGQPCERGLTSWGEEP